MTKRAITFDDIIASRRAELAAGCTRAVTTHANRNSRAECDKAHARFLAGLRASLDYHQIQQRKGSK